MPFAACRVRRQTTSSPGAGSPVTTLGMHKSSHLHVDNRTNALTIKHFGNAAQKFTPCTEVRTMAHKSSLLASHRSSHFAQLSTTKVRTLTSIQHRSSHFACVKLLMCMVFLITERLAGFLKGLLAAQSLTFPGTWSASGARVMQGSLTAWQGQTGAMAPFSSC